MDFRQALQAQAAQRNHFADMCQQLTNYMTIQSEVQSIGLNAGSVSWEDTGRKPGSSYGSNITDITLGAKDPRTGKVYNMLFIKQSGNFEDVTYSVPIEQLVTSVGNEKGAALQKISLCDYLENITGFTGATLEPRTDGIPTTLFKAGEKILISSQICVLPVKDGNVDFCVSAMNYQGAVLYIVIGPNGTSTCVDSGSGRLQELHFNDNGKAKYFSAQRLEDVRVQLGQSVDCPISKKEKEQGQFIIVQIPLVRKATSRGPEMFMGTPLGMSKGIFGLQSRGISRGFDSAVISTGSSTDKDFPKITTPLTRDFKLPIRVTLQHYCVTDTPEITAHVKDTFLRTLIGDIDGKATGSLVTMKGDAEHLTAFNGGIAKVKLPTYLSDDATSF